MKRKNFLSLTVGVFCALITSPRPVYAQQSGWKTRRVTLNCQDCSMQQVLEQLAASAGISVLAEGRAANKPFTFAGEAGAEDLLTQIADTYDYSWRASSSGIVVMTKRFTNEHEGPEINTVELRAAIQDVLRILRGIYTPRRNITLTDIFRQFASKLSVEEMERLKSGKGLMIATLSPFLRDEAVNVIYCNEFDTIYSQLEYLDVLLASLSTASIKAQNVTYTDGHIASHVMLFFRQTQDLAPFFLWDRTQPHRTPSPPRTIPPLTQNLPASQFTIYPLSIAFSVGQVFALLEKRFHITATISPRMQDKRVLLLLQDADATRVLPALAEMQNWGLQQKDAKDANAFFLYRRNVNPSRDVREVSKALLQVFPPDFLRCFYTRPKTLGDKPYQDIHDILPQLPGAGDPRDFSTGKLLGMKTAAQTRLRDSFPPNAPTAPTPYRALSAMQKELIRDILFYHVAYQIDGGLWKFLYKPNSYITDPDHARLIWTDGGFICIGPSGGRFEVIQGAPIR